jgi:hypothetical protein
MQRRALGLLVLGFLAVKAAPDEAVVCARGVYRAGRAGTHGAAVVDRPHPGAVWPLGLRGDNHIASLQRLHGLNDDGSPTSTPKATAFRASTGTSGCRPTASN